MLLVIATGVLRNSWRVARLGARVGALESTMQTVLVRPADGQSDPPAQSSSGR